MNFTGTEFKDWALVIAGNIFIVIFVIRSLGAYAKREWGDLFGNVLAGVFVAGLVYANEFTMSLLRQLFDVITR